MTYAFYLALLKNPSNCCINRCLLRSYATSRTIPPKPLHKSASKPVISSFYCGFTPLHLNGRLNAQVESDIVGYTTITMEAGKWYQVGAPFVALEDNAKVSLKKTFNTGFSAGDTVYIFSEAAGTYADVRTWGTASTGETTWLNSRGKPSDISLDAGAALFILKKTTEDVVLAGKVSANEVVQFGSATSGSWAQIVLPYPEPTDLNAMTWTGLQEGDELHVYDPDAGTYAITRYWSTGKTDTELKWRNSRKADVETIIPVGTAMFIRKVNAGVASLTIE